jgi:hypothetical protein
MGMGKVSRSDTIQGIGTPGGDFQYIITNAKSSGL